MLCELSSRYWYSDPPLSLQYATNALSIARQTGYEYGIAKALSSIGATYYVLGEYDVAADYFQQTLKIAETILNVEMMAKATNNLGKIYEYLGQYNLAIEFHERSYEAHLVSNNFRGIAYSLINTAMIRNKQGAYDKALADLEKALLLTKRHQLSFETAICHNNIGDSYELQGDYIRALDHYGKAIALFEDYGDYWTRSFALLGKARIYLKQADYARAVEFGKLSYEAAERIGAKDRMKEGSRFLVNAFQQAGQYSQAFQYQKIFQAIADSLYNEAAGRKMQGVKYQYELEKKEAENRVLALEKAVKQAELELSNASLKRQNLWLLAIALILILITTVAVLLYRFNLRTRMKNRQLARLNIEIGRKNEEIMTQAEQLRVVNDKMSRINSNLNDFVEERTAALAKQNEQLINYAYFNAHKVRGPLARIMGLVNMLQDPAYAAIHAELLEHLRVSTEEMDAVIHTINDILHEELPEARHVMQSSGGNSTIETSDSQI